MRSREDIKILLIEDDPGDAELIREILLGTQGVHTVMVQADRLSSAIERLEAEPFDLALSDLGLPDSQGIGTFLTVHAQYPYIPVIVLTGLGDEELALKAVQSGAQDYLVKGQFDGNLLVRSIRYSIERQKLITQLEKSLREVKTLRGLIPICAWCTKIRDDKGYWKKVETYIEEQTGAAFTHGICRECLKKIYPAIFEQMEKDNPEAFEEDTIKNDK